MSAQYLVFLARYLLSPLTGKRTRGQGLSEYLGLLVGLGVILGLVIIIITARLLAKANSGSW
jgi:hypothetical protein